LANLDYANGFTFRRCLGGEAVILEATAGGVALKKGDAVHMEAGVLLLAEHDDTKIYGIMAADAAIDATDAKFYPALPKYVFEVQTYSVTAFVVASHTNFLCDLIGGTGAMELNLGDASEDQFIVWKIADSNPTDIPNVAGANANVYCMVHNSQFIGILGNSAVHV